MGRFAMSTVFLNWVTLGTIGSCYSNHNEQTKKPLLKYVFRILSGRDGISTPVGPCAWSSRPGAEGGVQGVGHGRGFLEPSTQGPDCCLFRMERIRLPRGRPQPAVRQETCLEHKV